jgi:hypothetical protein
VMLPCADPVPEASSVLIVDALRAAKAGDRCGILDPMV